MNAEPPPSSFLGKREARSGSLVLYAALLAVDPGKGGGGGGGGERGSPISFVVTVALIHIEIMFAGDAPLLGPPQVSTIRGFKKAIGMKVRNKPNQGCKTCQLIISQRV